MRLFDYKESSDYDKARWMDSFKTEIGLRYFGGKSLSAGYILNRIFNIASRMYDNGDKADIFLDAFTGGGKIGLSIPEGWFQYIVINDLDYGVYSFYKSCAEQPEALVKLIEEIGGSFDEDLYHFFLLNRTNGDDREGHGNKSEAIQTVKILEQEMTQLEEELKECTDKREKENKKKLWSYKEHRKDFYQSKLDSGLITDKKLDNLVAGAMTYWITQTTWNGDTDAKHAWGYSLSSKDNKAGNLTGKNERERIKNITAYARRSVYRVHENIKRKRIIIENLDYRELLKKYNGLAYKNVYDEEQPANDRYRKANKLWYFDPPYHPATLPLEYGGKALYEFAFDYSMVSEMTDILLNNQEDIYGRLEYFVKSDYDPHVFKEELEADKADTEKRIKKLQTRRVSQASDASKSNDQLINEGKEKINQIERQLIELNEHLDDFSDLETSLSPYGNMKVDRGRTYKSLDDAYKDGFIYYEEDIGSFRKGWADDEGFSQGHEFIWCREKLVK